MKTIDALQEAGEAQDSPDDVPAPVQANHRALPPQRAPGAFRPRVRCVVCHHPERVRIEALRTAGMSLDKLSEQFGNPSRRHLAAL